MAESNHFSERARTFTPVASRDGAQTGHRTAETAGELSNTEIWLPETAAEAEAPENRAIVQLPLAEETPGDFETFPVFQPKPGRDLLVEAADMPISTGYHLRAQSLLHGWLDAFSAAIRHEREAGNLFNFVPVVMAVGIAAYFAAPAEPKGLVLLTSIAIAVIACVKTQSRGAFYLSICTGLLFFTGMGVAKWQVERAQMPIPLSDMTARLEGVVLAIDQNRRGAPRYLIRPTMIEGLDQSELPRKIRLSSAKNQFAFLEGQPIQGLARMAPITGPAYPGGYDFAFSAQLDGLGMSGFFMGAPQEASSAMLAANGQAIFMNSIRKVRRSIADRIRAGLPGEAGDIAVALITGDRSGLSADTQESLRRSGLAHILAISGLHMALVTLTVIWLVRLILVGVPGLVDRYPVKKVAIVAGFATATAYLVISGQAIATQRAWLMISVMLIASLLDRRAITMRSVAIAAIAILLVSPASVFQPGFQMSFAAVAALVAVYREWSDYRARRYERAAMGSNQSVISASLSKALGYFGGLATTSLIAGLATALFALWHFHRVAPLGLVSNLAAMPIVSVAVMPLALMVMFLMPYGFEQLALKPLGTAINAVLAVSDKVNAYELDFDAGMQPLAVLLSSAVFLVFACGLRSRLRWLSFAPLLVLIANLGQSVKLPDMLIAQDGRSLAINTALLSGTDNAHEPGLALLYPRRGTFITDIWQRAYLPNRAFEKLPANADCTNERCDLPVASPRPRNISVVYDPEQLPSACREADILIAPRLWWVKCRGEKQPEMIIKRSDLEARGSHALYFAAGGVEIESAWHHSLSEFERAEAQGRRQFPDAGTSGMKPHLPLASAAQTMPDPTLRPWQKRFDNISRRFSRK